MRFHTKEFQNALTPEAAYEVLVDGNKRFVNNLKLNRNLLDQMEETSTGQFPFAAVLSCMDSRTSVELIFDQGLGEIFSLRVAGNVVNKDIIGSLEYACKVAGSKLIVVLGHTRCGAIRGNKAFAGGGVARDGGGSLGIDVVGLASSRAGSLLQGDLGWARDCGQTNQLCSRKRWVIGR